MVDLPAQPTSDVTDAKEPFHSPAKADIILRSSNSVDFFVLKAFLSFASPVFNDMISLNRGEAVEDNEARNGLHIIRMQEDSETVYNLLLLVYPFTERPTADLGMHLKVARAARKYGMDGVEEKLKKQLTTSEVTEKSPIQAVAIAIFFDWKEEVKALAYKMFAKPLEDLFIYKDELELISAANYQALFRWRFECIRAVGNFLEREDTQREECEDCFVLKREILAKALLDRLKETDCPHSSVIMDDSTVVKALKNVGGHEIILTPDGDVNERYISSDNIDEAQEAMLKTCRSMATEIENCPRSTFPR